MICSNCRSKDTYTKLCTKEFEKNGNIVKVRSIRRFCEKCDELVYDEELDEIFHNKAFKEYNEKFGIPGQKIVELRKKLKLSQVEFSKIIGCAKKTLISYEKDKSIPNESYAILLNLLLKYPSSIKLIINSNKNNYTSKEMTKFKNKLKKYLED